MTAGGPATGLAQIEAEARRALSETCQVPPGQPISAACSGGADSVALVAVLSQCTDTWPLRSVIFVDHGLRQVEAERQAAQDAARRAGVPFAARRVEVPGSGNVQAGARHVRYEALLDAAGPDAVVATGHTLSDQAETVLQRLARGAGLRGLGAIRARRGRVVRPLLAVPGRALLGLGLPFAEDPSNHTDRYQRNRLRHSVMPLLEQENARVEEALARVASEAADELALVDALLDQLGDLSPDLRGLPEPLARLWIRWHARRTAPGLQPARGAVQQLARHLVSGGDHVAISLGDGVRGMADQGRLTLGRDPDSRDALVAPARGTYRCGPMTLVVGETTTETRAPMGPETTVTETWIDSSRMAWPLALRRVRSANVHGGAALECADGWELTDGAGQALWPAAPSPVSSHVPARNRLRIRMIRGL